MTSISFDPFTSISFDPFNGFVVPNFIFFLVHFIKLSTISFACILNYQNQHFVFISEFFLSHKSLIGLAFFPNRPMFIYVVKNSVLAPHSLFLPHRHKRFLISFQKLYKKDNSSNFLCGYRLYLISYVWLSYNNSIKIFYQYQFISNSISGILKNGSILKFSVRLQFPT